MLSLPSSPRFLITRLSAVGDCIHTIPLVHAIRRKYPDCFIAWATQNGPATLIEGVAGVDEIVRVPRDWMKSPKNWLRIRKRLRALKCDVAIDPQSLTKSCLLGWLSGAKCRIGFERPQGRELSLLVNRIRCVPINDHVVDRYLELLKPIGVGSSNVCFDMPHTDEPEVDAFLAEKRIKVGEFAVLNPGAGWPSKVWPAKRYGDVAKFLATHCALPSVVAWAGDEEKQMAEEICESSNGKAIAAPNTTLTELRELVRSAKLFIGSDTGPMHLAVAVGTPCVSIYGPTSPDRCGPYGGRHIALHVPVESNQKLRSDDNSAMLKISTSAVIEACEGVLDKLRRPAA